MIDIKTDDLKLWYQSPASCWKEALPLGNGRLGAMVYGNTDIETINLSEITCFSGESSCENNQKDAPLFFSKMRTALLNDDYENATKFGQGFIGKRLNYGTNLPLGNLVIQTGHKLLECSDYYRSLSLDTATTFSSYNNDNTNFYRTTFASNPHGVIVIKISCDKPGTINLSLLLNGGDNPYRTEIAENKDFLLFGNAFENLHSDGKTGVEFHGRMRVISQKGVVTAKDQMLCVKDSDEVLILIALGTNFHGFDPIQSCKNQIDEVALLTYENLLNTHIKDYVNIFDRVTLKLVRDINRDLPTDLWLKSIKSGEEDPSLTALMFQYGRYLLIASSRENSILPVHLQGVWNDNVACRIGWTCDMHLDINTQMNYWPAEVTNMPECNSPLFSWIKDTLVPSGRITAKESYGLSGWVAEIVSNPWGYTAPYWHTNLSPCPTSGVWVATHLWEHYLFTKDLLYLEKEAYPVIKESIEFFIEYVIEDAKTGYLTCGPSVSPENTFIVEDKPYSFSMGCTYEIIMIHEIFNAFIKACEALGYINDLVIRVKSAIVRLPPFQIGIEGDLKEWAHDYNAADSQHRHTSHLLGVYPFNQITTEKSPELVTAVKTSLKNKLTPLDGWEDTGWARCMQMLYSARLLQSLEAYDHILSLQKILTNCNLMVKHPPTRGAGSFADVYELDGNTGLTTCIAEMLMQSQNGEIHLLPVLPSQWSSGHVKGLCARGGFIADIHWSKGKLLTTSIFSKNNNLCIIRYGNDFIKFQAKKGVIYLLNKNLQLIK